MNLRPITNALKEYGKQFLFVNGTAFFGLWLSFLAYLVTVGSYYLLKETAFFTWDMGKAIWEGVYEAVSDFFTEPMPENVPRETWALSIDALHAAQVPDVVPTHAKQFTPMAGARREAMETSAVTVLGSPQPGLDLKERREAEEIEGTPTLRPAPTPRAGETDQPGWVNVSGQLPDLNLASGREGEPRPSPKPNEKAAQSCVML